MKKILAFSVVIAMLSLTGCGGNGNSSEPIYPEPEPSKPTLTGGYLNVTTGKQGNLLDNKKETVIVLSENEQISLGDASKLPAYATYGSAAAVLYNGDILLAHQGQATPESSLPTGVVNYSGNAFVLKSNLPYSESNMTVNAKVDIEASFNSKTLNGSISNITIGSETFRDIALQGQIKGNRFISTNSVVLDGGFYGPAAQNAVGVFKDGEQGLAGGFAADKK
ncbi:MAG: transferrin-binding protein-like solute binding protein [Cardiobacteriaceae bacterium]|nr:transferrin-binding protein-like solute binding protein [Cardiobacteriaceae bacterium]